MSMQETRFATTLKLTALSGVGLVLIAGSLGCKKEEAAKPAETPGVAAPADKTAAMPAMPGVTATEIKIGQSMPYSGPASAYGVIGKGDVAYFKMINDKGGINGRKINLISLDDSYAPPKAVENTRKLVENEGVAFIFNNVGTATNTAIQKYLNEKKVPQLFVATGADKWADPTNFPWTIGWQPSYVTEAKVYAKYVMQEKPNAKMCVLYQNDDFGKDYLHGLQEGFGAKHDQIVVKKASYEVTDPTIDSQIVSLQGAGCDVLLSATTPKFGAQSIRKVHDLGWKPLHLVSNVSVSRVAVLQPAGLDKSTGIITASYIKDINDAALKDDPGLNQYREFAKQYLQGLDINDASLVFSFGVSMTLAKVLEQCGDDLSRENIMKQAANLKNFAVPVAIDGILVNTAANDFRPFSEMRLARFNGENFEAFSGVLSADNTM